MKEKGKFIVIEGIDASGKNTQHGLLVRRLEKEKIKFITVDFPRYWESKWGKLVGRFLRGEFGKLDKVSPYLAVLPYMIDEYTWSRDVGIPWIEKGGVIISNRYFTSNVHQVAKLKTRSQKKFREWLWPIGYEELGILRPNLVILVDTPPLVAGKLIRSKNERGYLKGKKKDIAENNWNHQLSAYREYKRTVKENDWWVEVPGVQNHIDDFSIQIHERIWDLVRKVLDK
jgi:dTMP kinase